MLHFMHQSMSACVLQLRPPVPYGFQHKIYVLAASLSSSSYQSDKKPQNQED